nr:hypothetical protein [Streptomyces sp. TRM68416]
MTEAEGRARLERAARYRVFGHPGRPEMVFHHITVRAPGEDGPLLTHPLDGSTLADPGERSSMIPRHHGLHVPGPALAAASPAPRPLQRARAMRLTAQWSGEPLMPVTHDAAARSTEESSRTGDRTQAGRTSFTTVRRRNDRTTPDHAV